MKRTWFEPTEELPYMNIDRDGYVTVKTGGRAGGRIADMEAEYEAGRTQYQAELGLKRRLRAALKGAKNTEFDGEPHDLARPTYVMSVASIQTPTQLWESVTEKWLDGQLTTAEYLGRTENGRQKAKCVEKTLSTDLVERAQSELRRNHLTSAVHYLTGGDTDTSTYLRGTKAWMVVRWFYHVPCIDTNVHRAIEPVLRESLDTSPRYHRSMDQNQIGKAQRHGDGDGKVVPTSKRWIQERVGRYGEHDEMRTLWEVVDTAVRHETDIPREVVAQVAFNVGGRMNNGDGWERTTHIPIYEALGANMDRFRAD